jgi:hypothetical protein
MSYMCLTISCVVMFCLLLSSHDTFRPLILLLHDKLREHCLEITSSFFFSILLPRYYKDVDVALLSS